MLSQFRNFPDLARERVRGLMYSRGCCLVRSLATCPSSTFTEERSIVSDDNNEPSLSEENQR